MAGTTRFPDVDDFVLVTDRFTRPYWDAARGHRLVAMQCAECDRFRMPPTPFCPHCHSQESRWPGLSGAGTVYSFTIMMPSKADCDDGPLVLAVIEPDDAPGVRLVTNIVDSQADEIAIGKSVELVWQERDDGICFARFRLCDAG